jgi:phosphoenolpyruvate phosphomutase
MSLEYNICPDDRRALLKTQIQRKGYVRIIEVHSGLSALIAQKAQVRQNGEIIDYDGFWESSLTDTASKGMPDAEIVGYDSRSHTIDEILNVTAKPIIVDGDTGGSAAQFEYFVKRLERLGVSAVIIEDKTFPKRNSLDMSAKQTLEDPEIFVQKIRRGNEVKISDDFMIIARIESLIAGVGLEDALYRAEAYIRAGVDGIMIHSKGDKPDDILAFAEAYEPLRERLGRRPPLVCVPTTYNLITDQELAGRGFNIIIHANHLLRAAYKAMKISAETILLNDRSFEAEPFCAPVPEIFQVVGFERIKEKDREYSKAQRLSVIIPASGRDKRFIGQPKSLVKVGGKSILERQLEVIRKAGIRDVALVRGYAGDRFDRDDIKYYENPEFDLKYSLHSMFCAQDSMDDGFILVYSDILFNEAIFRALLESDGDIVLLVDNSYRYHKHEIDKRLDLVVSKKKRSSYYRSLQPSVMTEVTRIKKKIDKDEADFEFIGLAHFSEKGAETIKKVYEDCRRNANGPFHEAESFDSASIIDLIQEVIDRGFTVNALDVYKGWIEIHNLEDVEIAEREVLPLSEGSL